MSDFSDDLKTYLKTVAGVTTLVGSGSAARIFRDVLREGASYPALVYLEGNGGLVATHLGGLAGHGQSLLHTLAYGSTRTQANSLDSAVFLALCGTDGLNMRGSVGNSWVHSIRPTQRFFEYDASRDKAETPRYITRRVYVAWLIEATSTGN